ncbi:MAG: hypothetical protein RLZZ245_3097, partial [Verrucomicrobiota bacterium]
GFSWIFGFLGLFKVDDDGNKSTAAAEQGEQAEAAE